MDRREFLRKAGLIAAGVVAADQLEILERLTHKRRFFPSAPISEELRLAVRLATPEAKWFEKNQDQSYRSWTGWIDAHIARDARLAVSA